MGKKSSATAVSQVSAAATSAPTSTSNNSNNSSILRSAFAPSRLQLHLFASVLQSFDSQQLRLHDTVTGRLRQQHSARPGTTITSLDWGYYGPGVREVSQSSKKKRKRTSTSEDVVVAYGSSDSEICMFSPAEGRLIGTLSGAHERGIRDFKFSPENALEGWSVGGDGKLVQWDLSNDQAVKSISLPDPSISVLSVPSIQEPQLLCASTTPFSVFPSDDFRIDSFDSFKAQIHGLQRSGSRKTGESEYFLAVDNDRYINVFDIEHRKLVRTLVTDSGVQQLELKNSDEEQLLAAVTKDGMVELFPHPFKLSTGVNGDLKSKRMSMRGRPTAKVKVVDANMKTSKVFATLLQGPDLLVVTIDGAVEPNFQKLRWQDEGTGELLFEGIKEIVKTKNASTLNAAHMNGVKDMGKTHVDESNTVVVNGSGDLTSHNATIEISSEEDNEVAESEDDSDAGAPADEDDMFAVGSDNENDEKEDEPAEIDDNQTSDKVELAKSVNAQDDIEMEDAAAHELSFGAMLAAKHPTTIAITDTFPQVKTTFDTGKQLALPSGMSLATVLTQALRTNDTNLLESCLHANDVGIIQNTIQRLDSTLASNLLSKLAERLASRPGRYGHLLSWVQWTCIAHGGAIASQTDVTTKIRTLYRVLTQRSKSLDKLLLLKGKLDMLDAQLTLRKQMQTQRGTDSQDQGEPGMIYIEGQEDNWSSDEDDEEIGIAKKTRTRKQKRRALEDLVADEEASEDDEDMPKMNGVDSENSEDEESDEELEVTGRTKGMYDVEAEVSGEEENSDDEEDNDSSLDGSDEEDEEDEDDSSMDSFINDGEVEFASEEDEIDLDDEAEVRRPEKKRSKHR